MRKNVVSILIPLYNEEEFIRTLLDRVMAAPLPEGLDRELCIVDDCSRDRSFAIVQAYAEQFPGTVRVSRHEVNRGKGAAIRSSLELATGEYCVFQDADLEYDPREIARLLKPMLEGNADVVFGSRFASTGERRVLYFWHSLANRMLTLLCNMASNLNLTDMETCYKAFRTSFLKSIPIRSDRFGIEPEITIKVAKRRARVYETPVSYYGRTYAEGKKIGLKDAFDALWKIFRFAISNDIYLKPGPETLDALSSAPHFNQWMADTIAPFVGQRVLEIGAGKGNMTQILLNGHPRWVSADGDEENLNRLETRFRGRSNVDVRHCDLSAPEDFAALRSQMDSVICINELQLLAHDVSGLRNINSAIADGGRAIIVVPQDPRIYGTLDEALGYQRRYSPEELRTKMESAGFRVEKIFEFNRMLRPAWYLGGRFLRMRTLNTARMLWFDRMVRLTRGWDRHLPWGATSLIAIGEKLNPETTQAVPALP